MKRVGRSRVSAITHTPASGPLRLVTTPPRSLSPTVTGAGCWALTRAGGAPINAANAMAAAPRYNPALIVMTGSSRLVARPLGLPQAVDISCTIHAQSLPVRNDTGVYGRRASERRRAVV